MYVVTGASGNTGGVVARGLIAGGRKVRVIGRSAGSLRPLADEGAEVFVCDVSDAGALTKPFAGARAVYAMIPPSMTSHDYPAEQRRAADSIAAAIENAGVEYAVSLSSTGGAHGTL